MFKRIHRIMATAACGLTLALLSGPCAHAEANIVLSGQADGKPSVLVWVDTEKGTQLDGKAAKEFRSQFAGTEWTVLDNNQVTISKDGKALLGAGCIANNEETFFLVHGRAANQIVDGWVIVNDEEPSEGFGLLYVTELASDGRSSRTARITVRLTFSEG